MLVIGFDDERVRDGWTGVHWEEEIRHGVWLVLPADGSMESAFEKLREAIRAFCDAVVEVFRPLIEAIEAIGEAALRQIERAWEFIEAVLEEKRGQYKGPVHYNCRCLPVERVDPVRAGRTRWWARGKR